MIRLFLRLVLCSWFFSCSCGCKVSFLIAFIMPAMFWYKVQIWPRQWLLEAEYIKRWGVPKMEYAKIFQVIVMFIFIQYNGKPIVRAIPLYGMPWCTQIQMIAMATLCWPVHEMPCFLQVVGPAVRPWRKHCSLLLVLFCSVTRHVVGCYFSTFQMF